MNWFPTYVNKYLVEVISLSHVLPSCTFVVAMSSVRENLKGLLLMWCIFMMAINPYEEDDMNPLIWPIPVSMYWSTYTQTQKFVLM